MRHADGFGEISYENHTFSLSGGYAYVAIAIVVFGILLGCGLMVFSHTVFGVLSGAILTGLCGLALGLAHIEIEPI